MSNVYFTCAYCRDDLEMPAAWRGVKTGQAVIKELHEAVCLEFAITAASALVDETEDYLRGFCGRIQTTRDGTAFTCRNESCDGVHHTMIRRQR